MSSEENQGFDPAGFYDEGVKDAGINEGEIVTDSPNTQDHAGVARPVEKSETVPAKEPVKSEVQPEAEPRESIIDKLLPSEPVQVKQPEQRVPLSEHIKLRQRAQKAEQEAKELRDKLKTQTEAENSGEVSPLEKFVTENPEEDLVPAKVQLEQQRWQQKQEKAKNEARSKVEQAEQEAIQANQDFRSSKEAIVNHALKSEQEFRKTHADFDTVVNPFLKNNMLTDVEKLSCLNADNPAQAMYDLCQSKTDAFRIVLGIKPSGKPAVDKTTKQQQPATNSQNAASDLSDEEIFNEVYGSH